MIENNGLLRTQRKCSKHEPLSTLLRFEWSLLILNYRDFVAFVTGLFVGWSSYFIDKCSSVSAILMKLWNKIFNVIRHIWLTFQKNISKSENCSKFIMKVMFSRTRKHKPTKLTWIQKITSRHILVSFGAIHENCGLTVHLISLYKIMVWNVFAIYSKSTYTFFQFLFLLISLAKLIILKCSSVMHQLFYNRSGSYNIYALLIFISF